MRVLATSDIHGWLPKIEVEADVLLIAGDIVPDGFNPTFDWAVSNSDKEKWLREDFSEWVNSLPVKHVVVVAGNHDIPIQNNREIMDELPVTYLENSSVTIDDVVIWGNPWTPTFGHGWAFNAPDSALAVDWEMIPADVGILVTHGPPHTILDKTDESYGGYHVGSATLTNRLLYGDFPKLKLHVFGHIHPAYGKMVRDGVTHANVCYVDPGYMPANNPMFFEV